jgi:carboxypeptidase family protein
MSTPTRHYVRWSVLVAVVALSVSQTLQSRQTPARPVQDRQQPEAPPATGLIVGQVLDAAAGKPVPGAIVSLTQNQLPLGATGGMPPAADLAGVIAAGPAIPNRVIADSGGRFVFRSLPAGRYSFSATAAGYLFSSFGQRRPGGPGSPVELKDGEKVLDAEFRLWKAATITGTVVDEANEPVIGISVRTLRRAYSGGRQRWLPSSSAQTDDRGTYRIADLMPGDYAVGIQASMSTVPAATVDAFYEMMTSGSGESLTTSPVYRDLMASGGPSPLTGTGGVRVGDYVVQQSSQLGRSQPPPPPTDDGKLLVYETVYHGASGPGQVGTIALASGEDRTGIDLHLRLVPSVRVSGTVTGPDGPVPNIGVRLLPTNTDEFASETGLETANAATDAQGVFTFLGVPSGSYSLRVLKMPRPAPMPMSEGMVMVSSGTGMSFGTSVGSTPPPPPPLPTEPTLWATMPVTIADADVAGLAVTLRSGYRVTGRVEFEGTKARPTPDQLPRMSVTLTPLDSRTSGVVTPGRVTSDGEFRTLGFPAGRYLMSATPPVQGWMLKTAMFGGKDISDDPLDLSANDVAGVVLLFTDRMTQLTGTVRNVQGQTDPGADVILFPADNQRWKSDGVSARRSRSIRTTKAGAYSIQGLPPGEYFVVAVDSTSNRDWQDPGFLEAAAPLATRVTILEGDTKTQDLRTTRIR